jgi:hypothetical protein
VARVALVLLALVGCRCATVKPTPTPVAASCSQACVHAADVTAGAVDYNDCMMACGRVGADFAACVNTAADATEVNACDSGG